MNPLNVIFFGCDSRPGRYNPGHQLRKFAEAGGFARGFRLGFHIVGSVWVLCASAGAGNVPKLGFVCGADQDHRKFCEAGLIESINVSRLNAGGDDVGSIRKLLLHFFGENKLSFAIDTAFHFPGENVGALLIPFPSLVARKALGMNIRPQKAFGESAKSESTSRGWPVIRWANFIFQHLAHYDGIYLVNLKGHPGPKLAALRGKLAAIDPDLKPEYSGTESGHRERKILIRHKSIVGLIAAFIGIVGLTISLDARRYWRSIWFVSGIIFVGGIITIAA